jgi:Uma2 family endonuclease
MGAPVSIKSQATVEDLYRVPENGGAELVRGKLVLLPPSGGVPALAGGHIFMSLRQYERRIGSGYAIPANVGFLVDLPNRGSFCPDAAYYVGQLKGGKFLDGAPIFAVEVRSETDYGPAAEREMAEKRSDYFAAGSQVVWDVDVLQDHVVRAYVASDPDHPRVFGRGEVADAEPALPGWKLPVDDLYA